MSNQVVLRGNPYTDINGNVWATMVEQAKMLVPTGFLPKGIDTPAKAVAVMLKGRELGIPPMYALSNIHIIQGKPTVSAELLLAIIYRDQGDDALMFTETSETRATVRYKRRSWRETKTFTFSIEDAKRAEITTGSNAHSWKHYPAAMLRARCISAVARLAFPDSIGGMYTPDEMGLTVDYETGEVFEPDVIGPPAPALVATDEPTAPVSDDADTRSDATGPSLADRLGVPIVKPAVRAWKPNEVWPKLRKPLANGPELTRDQVHAALGVVSLDDWFAVEAQTVEMAWSRCADFAATLFADAAPVATE